MQAHANSAQPMRRLIRNLARLASEERYLFTPDDLRALVPDISDGAYKTLLSRAASEGHLVRVCRACICSSRPTLQMGSCCFMPRRGCVPLNSITSALRPH